VVVGQAVWRHARQTLGCQMAPALVAGAHHVWRNTRGPVASSACSHLLSTLQRDCRPIRPRRDHCDTWAGAVKQFTGTKSLPPSGTCSRTLVFVPREGAPVVVGLSSLARLRAMANQTDSRRWRRAALITAGVLLVVSLCAQIPRWVRKSFRPPGNAKTFAELVAQNPERTHLAKIRLEETSFYVWHGASIKAALPSGPSCFVFDTQGRLIAYTPTTGDLELAEYCDVAWKEPAMRPEQVLREIEASRAEAGRP